MTPLLIALIAFSILLILTMPIIGMILSAERMHRDIQRRIDRIVADRKGGV